MHCHTHTPPARSPAIEKETALGGVRRGHKRKRKRKQKQRRRIGWRTLTPGFVDGSLARSAGSHSSAERVRRQFHGAVPDWTRAAFTRHDRHTEHAALADGERTRARDAGAGSEHARTLAVCACVFSIGATLHGSLDDAAALAASDRLAAAADRSSRFRRPATLARRRRLRAPRLLTAARPSPEAYSLSFSSAVTF